MKKLILWLQILLFQMPLSSYSVLESKDVRGELWRAQNLILQSKHREGEELIHRVLESHPYSDSVFDSATSLLEEIESATSSREEKNNFIQKIDLVFRWDVREERSFSFRIQVSDDIENLEIENSLGFRTQTKEALHMKSGRFFYSPIQKNIPMRGLYRFIAKTGNKNLEFKKAIWLPDRFPMKPQIIEPIPNNIYSIDTLSARWTPFYSTWPQSKSGRILSMAILYPRRSSGVLWNAIFDLEKNTKNEVKVKDHPGLTGNTNLPSGIYSWSFSFIESFRKNLLSVNYFYTVEIPILLK